jgi:hypothetical protein
MLILFNLLQPIERPSPNLEDPEALKQFMDPGIAPKVGAVQASAPSTSINPNAYLAGLFDKGPAAPTYSQENEKALLNMGKAQKVGDLLTLLGDVYGTVKGARVQPRQFTSSAPYLQQILTNREKYRQQMQDFQNQKYKSQIQAAMQQAKQANADRDFGQKAKQFERTQGLKEDQFGVDKLYKGYLVENGLDDNALNRDKFAEQIRQFGITSGQKQQQINQAGQRIGLEGEKVEIARDKTDKTKEQKVFTYANWRGKELPIYEGDYRKLLEEGLRRQGQSDADIKTILARYAHQPTEEYKQIAVKEKIKQMEDADNEINMPLIKVPGMFNPDAPRRTNSAKKPSLFE